MKFEYRFYDGQFLPIVLMGCMGKMVGFSVGYILTQEQVIVCFMQMLQKC